MALVALDDIGADLGGAEDMGWAGADCWAEAPGARSAAPKKAAAATPAMRRESWGMGKPFL
jgi:hypothetical protein